MCAKAGTIVLRAVWVGRAKAKPLVRHEERRVLVREVDEALPMQGLNVRLAGEALGC